jgi:hypothetical protein
LSAGASRALVALSAEPAVRGSAGAAQWVAHALYTIARYAAGKAACIAAGARPALAALAAAPAVAANAAAVEWVGRALARV